MEKLNGIGEIVSWDSPKAVEVDDFRGAMTRSGLDPKLARDVCPANAFRRAVHDMEANRVIRQVSSDKDNLKFQFTAEHLNGTEYQYAKECVVVLSKTTGNVTCPDYGIEKMAQSLVNEKIKYRYAADVTRTIKKLFDDHGDLISLRSAGGVYFVPQCHIALCDQVERAMIEIGGKLTRWEQFESVRNTVNAAEVINNKISSLIDEAETCVDGIDEKDDAAMVRHVDRVNVVRLKIESYRGILSDRVDDLEASLSGVNDKLMKAMGLADVDDKEPEPVPVVKVAEEPVVEEELSFDDLLAQLTN